MNKAVSREGIKRLLGPPDAAKKGSREVSKGIHLEVIEERSWKPHSHIRGSLPTGEIIESGFATGPIFSFFCTDSHVDVRTGMTIVDQKLLFEPALSWNVIDRYEPPSVADYQSARILNDDQIALPLATVKMKNYCRFWLDSMAKLFVIERSATVRELAGSDRETVVAPKLKLPFQREAIELLKPRKPVWTIKRSRLVRGGSLNSTGIVYGGGQNVGSVVRDFSRHLNAAVAQKASPDEASARIYVSRNEAGMRRVLNEEEIIPGLKNLGFEIIRPGNMPLSAQVEKFHNAKIIVAPHGAALTNLIFCRPGLTFVEIFPRGGVHGSMFLRIASHLDFNYYFVVGNSSPNAASETNPNNADVVLDGNAFISFVRGIIQ
jgi:capsular polysaccharide biosynthesis protein